MRISRFIVFGIAILFFATGLIAQDIEFKLESINDFRIEGDSNVRKWEGIINSADGRLVFADAEELDFGNLQPEHFKNLRLSIPVADISSDSGILTNNIHNNLKKNDHPNITFRLNDIVSVTNSNGRTVITAIGTINAAGSNHQVTMNVNAELINENTLRFSGHQDMLMTDFNIDPPSAMMGAFRSVDEITIVFDVLFIK